MHSRPMKLIPAPAIQIDFATTIYASQAHTRAKRIRPGIRHWPLQPACRSQVDEPRAGKEYGFRPAPCAPFLEERASWRTAQAPAGIACARAPALWPQRPQEPSLARTGVGSLTWS